MTSAANHFGHRESGGLVIDLFWDHGKLEDEFRVAVEDRRDGARFVLHPATGRGDRGLPPPFLGRMWRTQRQGSRDSIECDFARRSSYGWRPVPVASVLIS
jgi:hypothetical protein